MHAHNIMHRDLKPQNILLRKENDYDCVVADFGLAEHCENDPYLFVRCGTPVFVAPEVININNIDQTYGCECDMFCLGVIFYILMIGKEPFHGNTYDKVF